MRYARRRLAALAAVMTTLGAVVLAGIAATPAAAAGDYQGITGSGSTWSANMIKQWTADVWATYAMSVTYNSVGSSSGRQQFAQGTNDFGVTEIPYGSDETAGPGDKSDRPYAYLPIVAGGTAFTYHLQQAGQQVWDLRLSPRTLTRIFAGEITKWDDPDIKADNNGRQLPPTPIVVVGRSEGSGTTAQFTRFMDKQFPDIWRKCEPAGMTSQFPEHCGSGSTILQSGSDGVVNYIKAASGDGTIGYVEYSYIGDYPTVKVLNPAGFYVEPTPFNVAVALTKARIETANKDPKVYLTQILDDVYTNPDPRSYPISSYSYMIIPTSPTDQKATAERKRTLADFLFYAVCQGQSAAVYLGYSPLPLNLVQAGFEQIKLLGSDMSGKDVSTCSNPTFDKADPGHNRLTDCAPPPLECNAQGKGPCLGQREPKDTCGIQDAAPPALGGAGKGGGGSVTVGGKGDPGGTKSGAAAGAGSGTKAGGGQKSAAGSASGATGGAVKVDPVTGEVLSAETASVATDVGAAVTTDIPPRVAGTSWLWGGLTVAALLGVVLVPGLSGLVRRGGRS